MGNLIQELIMYLLVKKGIKHSYSKGKKVAEKTSITDRINALPLYKSSNVQIAANGDTKK